MDEEDEDLLDLFADDSDPLLSTDVVDQCLESDNGRNVDKAEENGDPKHGTKPADEATALAELPNYTPIEKDKDVNMDVKVEGNISVAGTRGAYSEIMSEPLSEDQKIDSSLSKIIFNNKRREDRKRQLNSLVDKASEVRGRPMSKRRYMTKNGVQLCLHPRRDISELSKQDIGNELARCLDEPKKILMEDTVSVIGLDKALELLAETAEIQKNGGMTTQDGNMKRPGGVFISLLKQRATEEQMKSIFRRDRQMDNQSKKKRKRLKVKQDKAKVAQIKKQMNRELEKLEEQRWNEQKQRLPNVGLEKRFGIGQSEVDLMEVDEVDAPVCDDGMTLETTSEDHQESSNHDDKVNGNHDDEVNGNHDNEMSGNLDNEILLNDTVQ